MSELDFKTINDELNQQSKHFRDSSRVVTRRVHYIQGAHPHAFVIPSVAQKAKAIERRVFLFVISSSIGIIFTLGAIWLMTK